MKLAAAACLTLSVALAILTAVPRLRSAVEWNDTHAQDDFGVFYETARCLATNACQPYPPDAETPNLNPPHFHFVLLPMLTLTPRHAYWAWLVCSAAALLLTGWRVVTAGLWRQNPWWLVGIGVLMLLSAPAHLTIATGQVYVVLGYPLAEAWLAARSGRWRLAAGLVAVVATVKPILLLPLAWITWQSPRSALRAVSVAGAAMVAGAMVFGIQPYLDWMQNALAAERFLGSSIDGSFLQTAYRTFSQTEYFPAPPINAPSFVRPVWMIASLAVLVDLLRWVRTASIDRAWLGLIAAMLIVSPKGWIYSGWWLMWPAVAVWNDDESNTPFLSIGAAGLMAIEAIARTTESPWLVPLTGSVYFWTWTAFYLSARRTVRPAAIASRQ